MATLDDLIEERWKIDIAKQIAEAPKQINDGLIVFLPSLSLRAHCDSCGINLMTNDNFDSWSYYSAADAVGHCPGCSSPLTENDDDVSGVNA